MVESIVNGLSGLAAGTLNLHWSNPIMIVVGLVLLYLGIKKDFEPLLLVPIGFGCILVNIPLADVMEEHGFLRTIYDAGIMTELFPLLIFIGIGAMTDFSPVLENPMTFFLAPPANSGSSSPSAWPSPWDSPSWMRSPSASSAPVTVPRRST